MKWYAMCTKNDSPAGGHEVEANSGQYLPWVGPDHTMHADARKDAEDHNKNAGHTAQVFNRVT